MEVNVIIISDNQISVEFWADIVRKELIWNVRVVKTSSLNNLHHLITSDSIVILDDYFTSPEDDNEIIRKSLHIKRINESCKIYGVSPCYAHEETRSREIIAQVERYPFSNELLSSINDSIELRINNQIKYAI